MHIRRLTALALALALCLGLMTIASAANKTAADFPDYNSKAWYAEAMSAAVEDGLLRGDDQGLLRPNGYLTRAEMAAIVNRSFGTYQKADITNYKDVKPGAWYYEDVAMAVHMGTYNGTSVSTMAPDTPITRQEAMTVVARALQLDLEDYVDTSISQFGDHSSVAKWALPYVRAMVGADYIHGNEKRELAPRDNITRAEFSQIFYNIIQEYLLASGTYTEDYTGNLLIRTDDVILRNLTVDGDLIIGCGAADGKVTLDNVTVTGRVVVWGGGTQAVYMNNGTDVEDLIVCRVDGPVKVIFDRDSTLAVYPDIDVSITSRAKAFPETEVIFYDISDILEEQDKVNDAVDQNQISIAVPAHMYVVTEKTSLVTEIVNKSKTDTYRVELIRDDTHGAIAEPVEVEPGITLFSLQLTENLTMGDYPCTALVTRLVNGQPAGALELSVTVHSAYLWNK